MFKIEDHEKHINDLSQLLKVEGVDQAKVSTILQGLRDNYTEVNTTVSDSLNKITSINELNEGLRSANMTLLAKLGKQFTDDKPATPPATPPTPPPTSKTLDEIAKELY